VENWRGRDLGTIIAERGLYLDDLRVVRVRIGTPVTSEEAPHEAGCPYQIDGLGSGKVRFIFGVDGVQALWLALQTIGSDLYNSGEYRAGRLKAFMESPPCGDLGFPIIRGLENLLPQCNDD
jgi:hypothetical protein